MGIPRVLFDVATLPVLGAAKLEDRYRVVSWLEDRASASYGSEDQAVQASFSAGRETTISTLVRYERADDLLFRGLGADGPEARFGQDRFLAILGAAQRVGPLFALGVTGIYNRREMDAGTLPDVYDPMTPRGFVDGIDNIGLQANLRCKTPGLRVEAFAGAVPDPSARPDGRELLARLRTRPEPRGIARAARRIARAWALNLTKQTLHGGRASTEAC